MKRIDERTPWYPPWSPTPNCMLTIWVGPYAPDDCTMTVFYWACVTSCAWCEGPCVSYGGPITIAEWNPDCDDYVKWDGPPVVCERPYRVRKVGTPANSKLVTDCQCENPSVI